MSKGLEALEDLKNAFIGHCRELECKENYIKVCENKFNLIEKELKALEIIKDRLIVKDKGGYIQVVCEFSIPSKSKKYDLLKEVLLCH